MSLNYGDTPFCFSPDNLLRAVELWCTSLCSLNKEVYGAEAREGGEEKEEASPQEAKEASPQMSDLHFEWKVSEMATEQQTEGVCFCVSVCVSVCVCVWWVGGGVGGGAGGREGGGEEGGGSVSVCVCVRVCDILLCILFI
jgi:hypothetical protein